MTNKNILENALLQVVQIEEAVKQNAKGVLASTMKQELNDLLKESEEELKTAEETEDEMSEQLEDEIEPETETEDTDETDVEDTDVDAEEEVEDEEEMDSEDELGMEDETEDDDVLDMTNASDDEVLKVFKSMKPEDGIIVKKDGDDVSLEMEDDEYIIKLGEDESEDYDGETEIDENEEEEETIYEITLDEEDLDTEMDAEAEMDNAGEENTTDDESQDENTEDDEESGFVWFDSDDSEVVGTVDNEKDAEQLADVDYDTETEIDEASRTLANDVRKPANHSTKFKAGRPEINEALKENAKLKKQNEVLKKTIVAVKDKLNEIALFNSNLTYSTKLFTEHSTTKKEKTEILRRFDATTSINESTQLYRTIKSELENSKPVVNESVVNNISVQTKSSSSDLLSESKAYESQQLARIKQLMAFKK